MINFNPKIKRKFDKTLLNHFEHRLYLSFIVGAIDNVINNYFYCKKENQLLCGGIKKAPLI